MRLISYEVNGLSSFGAVSGDQVVDLRAHCGTGDLRDAIASGLAPLDLQALGAQTSQYPLAEVKLFPPIPNPDKIVCIGLNYRAHAAEGGFEIPQYPSLFLRTASSLVGGGAKLVRPRNSSDFDFEGELAIVIGRRGRHIGKSAALSHVFGYSCLMDGSIRDFQFKHSLSAGKNFPASGSFGPWIATADQIPAPNKLTLTTRLNGREVQHKGTDDMIFDVPTIVSYVSSWTELLPGDVIATGTPEGVGFARKPPLWLKAGDRLEVEISGIGCLTNTVVDEDVVRPPSP